MMTAKTTPKTVMTPARPFDLREALWTMFPMFAIEPEAKMAIIQVRRNKPTTKETTSSMSGLASPSPFVPAELVKSSRPMSASALPAIENNKHEASKKFRISFLVLNFMFVHLQIFKDLHKHL